ncbi:hypothetical protein [Acinetobacter bereziniae]|uniref:hypothetical protein n=1 Tax=Acinetobacter bereziniae TaxID=106648 RepID=UPI00124FAAF4|nr:hypothetical protein [Acinetobacter bereziniae]
MKYLYHSSKRKEDYLENFLSSYNYDSDFLLKVDLNFINFHKKYITITHQGLSFHYTSHNELIEWIKIDALEIKLGFFKDTIIINNKHFIKTNIINRRIFQLLKKEYPKLQRFQKLLNLKKINKKNNTFPLNIMQNELYPEIIPITLTNLFHFLACDENLQCNIILYRDILNIFLKFPLSQKKLIERRLNSSLILSEEAIFKQVSDIKKLLPLEVRQSILKNFIIIINQTEIKNKKEIIDLLRINIDI